MLTGTPADRELTVDRRLGAATIGQSGGKADTHQMQTGDGPDDQRWDLLVENSGRINYSKQLRSDRKGVVAYTPPVGKPPLKWYTYPLPMTNPSALKFRKTDCLGPCFYRGMFTVDKPGDTFLDTSNLTKGQLWINGHALGRFWKIGPQKTLYVPAPWLKKGANEVVVFDVDGKPGVTLQGLAMPVLGD